MAANVIARNALQRIGFTPQASTYIVDTQGFIETTDYMNLTDDEASNLCKITRRPGGADAANPGNANQGFAVSLKAENNLKLMCYFLRYRERTSRPAAFNDVQLPDLTRCLSQARAEKDHEDPSDPEVPMKGNWTRTIEVVEDYLRNCLGATKIPLAYVIRDNIEPKPHGEDPQADYSSFNEELIARAPHHEPRANQNAPLVHTQACKDDNIIVFNKLAAIFREKDCWTYMQKATRTRDGRMAFMALKTHCLGKNNVDNLANQAERQLQNTTYTGEARRWNFEKYVKTHVDQHQTLTDLTRHGCAGIDPRSKVRYLLDGIKTKDLDNVKTRILSDEHLRVDFDACVNLFQDFVKQTRTNEPRRANISAIERGSRGQDKGNNPDYDSIQPDMSVEDRYYTKAEYSKLSAAKRKGLSIKRQKRGHKPGEKSSKTSPKKGKRTFNKRVISAIKRIFSDVTDKEEEETGSEEEEQQPQQEITNRENKALKRKKT